MGIEIARIRGPKAGGIGLLVQRAGPRDHVDHPDETLAFGGRKEIAKSEYLRLVCRNPVDFGIGHKPFAHTFADAPERVLVGDDLFGCHNTVISKHGVGCKGPACNAAAAG